MPKLTKCMNFKDTSGRHLGSVKMLSVLVLAYFLIGLTGVSFGLIGAGGAILIVPIMVYMMGIESGAATGYALPISLLVSGTGAWIARRQGQVDLARAVQFGVPTALSTFATRKLLVPQIPLTLFGLPKSSALMFGFALILVGASVSMFFSNRVKSHEDAHPWTGTLLGLGVGLISGLFGIGGGFMIVPILAVFFGIDMKKAVGTSLTAVVMITALGFFAEFLNHPQLPWAFLGGVTVCAASGMVVGSVLRERVDSTGLKAGFKWFVLGVAVLVVGLELWKLGSVPSF